MQTPGQRIREARELAGYDQGEFAKAVGMARSTLAEIESGETKLPSIKVALSMSKVLGKTISWIVDGKDGAIETPTEQEQELLNMTRSMSDESKAALIATAKALSNKAKD